MRHRRLAAIILTGMGWAAALDPAPARAPEPAAAEASPPTSAAPEAVSETSPATPQPHVSPLGFRAGQVWKFKARPGEEGATVTVLLVELAPRIGVIVHVRLAGLHVRSPENEGGVADDIGYLPISGTALAQSVTTLVRESEPLPDFGYDLREWRRLAAAGRVGVYNMTVAKVIEAIERKLNR